MAESSIESVTRLCPFCEACCGLVVSYEPTTHHIVSIKGDKDNPFSQGFLCPKSQGFKLLEEDPDRLRAPLIRQGRDLVETDYDTAIDFAASAIKRIRAKHGGDSISMHIGNPVAHNIGLVLYGSLFLQMFPTRNAATSGSIDHIAKCVSSVEMFGCEATIPVPDIDRTQHIIIIGANPVVSNGSLVTAPGWPRRLQALKARGGKIVVIDPRRTETSQIADQHVFLKPATDAYLMIAMVHVLFEEGLVKLGALQDHVTGVERLRDEAKRFAPERVAGVTGVPADTIRQLARDLAAAESGVVYGRIGTTAQKFGAMASWLIDVLNLLTGNLDRPGGAMIPKPVTPSIIYNQTIQDGVSPNNRWTSRVSGLPEVSGFIPIAAFPDEILTPGEGQVRALLTLCSNPARSTPNSARWEEALSDLEFLGCLDIYLNETGRFADVILPPSGHMEQQAYPPFSPPYMVRSYAKWDDPVFPSAMPSDGEIMLRLAARVAGVDEGELARSAMAGIVQQTLASSAELSAITPTQALDMLSEHEGPAQYVDMLIRIGPFGDKFGLAPDGMNLAKLKTYPHGIDLGAMIPQFPEKLATPEGKIRVAPDIMVRDIARLEAELPIMQKNDKMLLVGRRHIRSNNSWMHNVRALAKGPDRTTLLMNGVDAREQGLNDGDTVKLSTKTGEVFARIELSEDMMPGVISLAHGYGHDAEASRLSIAKERPGPNFNTLLDEADADVVSGTAVLSGIPVSLSRVA
jgi:anaerobic selenocysteine-containing dehydrogenase